MTSDRVLQAITELQPGEHLGFLYRTEAEHRAILTPFLRQGLVRGEKVLYLTHYFHPAGTILDYLRDDGLDVDPYLASGQLSFESSTETYLQTGTFDTEKTIAFWQQATEQALTEGYQALRGVGDLNWALEGLPGSERLLEFEARLDGFLPGSRCLLICLYEWQHLTSEPLLTLLATHPTVVMNREMFDNFCYLPAQDLQPDDLPATVLRYWLERQAERQQTGAELRASQQRLSALFEHALDAILLADDEGRYVDANPAACDLLGYSREALLQRHIWDLTSDVDVEAGRQLWQTFLSGGQQEGEYRLQRRDGTLVQVEYRAATNIVPGLHLSIMRDITERKQSEQELIQTKTLLQKTLNSLTEVVCIIDPAARTVLTCNAAVERVFGYRPEEVIGQNTAMLHLNQESYEAFGRKSQADLDREGVFHTEHKMRRKNGDVIVTEHTVRRLWDAEGWPAGVVSVIRDITARKQAEEAQRRYAERLRILRDIDQAILTARSPAAIAYATLEYIQDLVPCVRASVVTFDSDTQRATTLAVQVAGETRLRPREKAPPGEILGTLGALRQGKVYSIRDIRRMPSATPGLAMLKAAGVRAYASVPLISHGELVGALNLGLATPGSFTAEQLDIAREVANSLVTAIQQAHLLEAEQEARGRLQALSRQLLQVQEAERRHIARELHDEVGQILTGLKLMLDISGRADDANLARARSLVDDLVERIDSLSLDLRPPMLDDLGLLAALLWHLDRYSAQTGIQVKFRHHGLEGRRFWPEVETAAYRIVQEALTNVARHAGVSAATVQLWAGSAWLTVHIEDDGQGFELDEVQAAAISGGLPGMQERAALLGGRFMIESSPGQGTYLTAKLPLKYPEKRSETDDNDRISR